MAGIAASGRYPNRARVVYRKPDSEYFNVITPYFSNVRLRFANRTYGPNLTYRLKLFFSESVAHSISYLYIHEKV